MRSIIIVDDEPLARKRLRDMMSDYPEFRIVAEAGRLNEARKLIIKHSPDVLLLDIHLFGENGFDLIEDLPENTKVIFITAYDKYAVRAFEVNALDYLMKPVTQKRLENALMRLNRPGSADFSSKPNENILPIQKNDTVYLQSGRKRWFEPVDSIIVICAEEDHSSILLANPVAQRVLMRRTLGEWGNYLPSGLFMRIHQSTIIRVDYVVKTDQLENGSLSIRLRGVPGAFIADSQRASELLRRLPSKET